MASALRPRQLSDLSPLVWAGIPIVTALVGAAIGLGRPAAAAVAIVPLLVFATGALAGPGRWGVVLLAFASGFVGDIFIDRIPFGGSGIFFADFLVAGAVGGLVLEWLLKPQHRRPRLPRSALLGIPLLLFVGALMIGAVRGHQRYDATLIGMPLRLAAYAVIVAALPGVTPARALRGLTAVMYAGAVWLTGVAAYHIATGTSATEHDALSTGGIRYIGITAATYAAAAFLLAVLNLGARRGREPLHLAIALIAGFDIIVAYTRTVWLALVVILVVALLVSAPLRSAFAASVPLAAPVLALGVLMTVTFAPDLVQTLVDRVTTPAGEDTSVQWRAEAYRAVLSGTSDEPVLGIGFGRTTSFSINGMPNVITGDPHNGLIYVYAGSGILGVASLIVLLVGYVAMVARRWLHARGQSRTLVTWCFCTWLLVLVHALSEPVFTSPHFILVFWITMLLPTIVGPEEDLARSRAAASSPHLLGLSHLRPVLVRRGSRREPSVAASK